MFKKLTSCLSTGLSKVADFSQTQMLDALSRRYPDIQEVLDVLEKITGAQNEAIEGPSGETEDVPDDGKWRPILLTMGLLYKLQKIHERGENSWYNSADIFVHDDEKEKDLLEVFGFYWHLCIQVAQVLRSSDIDHTTEDAPELLKEALKAQIETLSIEPLLANATDNSTVDQHLPDFALLLDHPHQMIVINICGTRMIPAPKMSDVFMDLYATAEPFLNGKAHRGMAIGANNILNKINDLLQEAVDNHPDYGILVTGYSLGAGICQLVAMALLQKGRPNVRCISYGAPLVFASDVDNPEGQHLFTVVCSHDGLASASVATLSRLLAQVRAVDRLQLRKRDMVKLLMSNIECEDGTNLKEEDDSEDDEEFDKEKLSTRSTVQVPEQWVDIDDAIKNVEIDEEDLAKLTHPSKNIFVFKRRASGEVITRYFQDGGYHFAENLRLRGAMFSHHMPWSYKSLFDGYGQDQEKVTHDLIVKVLNL